MNMLGMAIIGGPEKVRERIDLLLEKTDADELIFTCDVYEHADRLRSYQILSELKG
jgi:alkanesulfonate monooxygenase SsuD/methylene tetrahydromethanopterin reductase-like flavin-dependent oxidoreductase (luciferase family)